MGRLANKVAIITGAGSGIGRESALLFAREGARVAVAEVNDAAGRKVVGEIESAGGEALFVHADVSVARDAEAMVDAAEKTWGRLDVLFNNAGIFPAKDGSVLETDEDTWDLVMRVNLKGVFFGCKYAIPAMLRAGGGSIVNTASFVALVGAATHQIAYTASKGGVLAMTREIAIEFARKNIRANALCPGPVDTPLLKELFSDPARRARRMVHIPPGRLAQAKEIAQAALFLASDESSYVNGSTFNVDGGITAADVTPEDPIVSPFTIRPPATLMSENGHPGNWKSSTLIPWMPWIRGSATGRASPATRVSTGGSSSPSSRRGSTAGRSAPPQPPGARTFDTSGRPKKPLRPASDPAFAAGRRRPPELPRGTARRPR